MKPSRLQDGLQPLVETFSGVSAVDAFLRLSHLPHVLFFDSAMLGSDYARYSFVTADPVRWLEQSPTDDFACLHEVENLLSRYAAETAPGLPPFQGGIAGLFGYELGRCFEKLPVPKHDAFQVPALAVGLYDVVLAWDHVQNGAWIIAQYLQGESNTKRKTNAEKRLKFFRELVQKGDKSAGKGSTLAAKKRTTSWHATENSFPHNKLSLSEICEQFPTNRFPEVTSNFRPESYQNAVAQAIEYIHAGDIFQTNLSQRLILPAKDDSVSLYLRLRERNAAPFAGYLDCGTFQILSASPERFIKVIEGRIETLPIKGTRPRTQRPEADLFAGDELLASEKDRAENVMIVDLMRNDLSRVCKPESVQVTQLCELETYAFVQHLVSTVQGKLLPKHGPIDVLAATFPGGSITGAPKIRAMEIITELETIARGAYCGSLGYLSLDGTMDTSILIRTITAGRGWWQFSVGGGIVADSDPRLEYEETWHKAEGILRALEK